MVNFISLKKVNQQNKIIITEMSNLLKKIAYDGRAPLKVRFRKVKDSTNQYLIELRTNNSCHSSIINLENNPFGLYWFILSKKKIKKGLLLTHCKKSRFGGYTFY